MVKQVKKWSTTWRRAFNNLRISEFSSYWPSFVCVWTVVKRDVNVSLQLCGAVHSPQSTLWKTRRYLTNSVVSSNKAVISDADLLSFLTHTLKCGQWRNNKSNINGEENQTLTFVPQIFIHSLSHIQKHFPVY